MSENSDSIGDCSDSWNGCWFHMRSHAGAQRPNAGSQASWLCKSAWFWATVVNLTNHGVSGARVSIVSIFSPLLRE